MGLDRLENLCKGIPLNITNGSFLTIGYVTLSLSWQLTTNVQMNHDSI